MTYLKALLAFLWTIQTSLLIAIIILNKPFTEPPPTPSPSQQFKALYEAHKGSVMRLRIDDNRHSGGGTGFFVKGPSGRTYILTNAHVCGSEPTLYIDKEGLEDKDLIPADVIDIDEDKDLCLLQGPIGQPLDIAEHVEPLTPLLVVGHPHLGFLTPTPGYLISRQVIEMQVDLGAEECKGPGLRMDTRTFFILTVDICLKEYQAWHTSFIIYPGNSGSPVVNKEGQVVGVVFAANTATHAGLVVPLEAVKEFMLGY